MYTYLAKEHYVNISFNALIYWAKIEGIHHIVVITDSKVIGETKIIFIQL